MATTEAPTTETASPLNQNLPNPVFDNANLKAMADKYRHLTTEPKAPPPKPEAKAQPEKQPDPAPKSEPKAEEKTEIDDLREKLPGHENPRRAEFLKLQNARDDFRRQAEENKKLAEERAAQLKKYEEELTTYKKALPDDPSEITKALGEKERLSKELEEMQKTIETINFERSPKFQNWWKSETEKHIKTAQRQVKAEHREEIAKLMMEPPSLDRDAKIDAIMETMPNVSKRILTGAIEQIESVKIQREEALMQGSENLKKLQEAERQETVKQKAEREARLTKLTKAALANAQKFDAFKPTDDAEHNAEIKQREAFVTAAIQGKLDDETAIMLPSAAAEGLYLRSNVIPRLQGEIDKLNKLVRDLQASDPRPGDGNTSKETAAAPEGETFSQKVQRLMRG